MQLGNRTFRVLAALALATALGAACGDDDDDDAEATTTTEAEETTTTAAAEDGVNPEFAEYCAAVGELPEDDAPTVEQLEAVRAAAPEDIAEEVDTLVDAFLAAIESGDVDSLFDDPELVDEFDAVKAFEAENCGGEDAAGEVNPEFAEYCAAVAEIDESDEAATVEQIEAVRAAAPDEISAEIEIVVDAFVAAIEAGTPDAPFTDPAVEEAFGPIEEFEAENCGEEPPEPVDRSAINPEFEEYCELAIEVYEQPSFPTVEQLEQHTELAPEDIADETAIVVPAFIEAIEAGDFEAAFSDPEVESNLERDRAVRGRELRHPERRVGHTDWDCAARVPARWPAYAAGEQDNPYIRRARPHHRARRGLWGRRRR